MPENAPLDTQRQWKVVAEWLGAGSINLFGLPFAGKDTQGHRLAEHLDAPLIGGGDILRSQKQLLSAEGRQRFENGELAPQDEYLAGVTPYLMRPEFAGRPLVLSSLGRWHGEEAPIFQSAADAEHPIRAVIFLHLDAATMQSRWHTAQADGSRGSRPDDDAHKLDTRLQEFAEKTEPVIAFYREHGLVIDIDGEAEPDRVEADILGELYARAIQATTPAA